MITVIIGHRGTGKSSLAKRIQMYLRSEAAEFVDLDEEIEKKLGRSISVLFQDHGEAYFREVEQQVFLEVLQTHHQEMYLVVGAGFPVASIPSHCHVLWVRRNTDLEGRIFLDRPRLNPEISPIDEYKKRAFERQPNYQERADEVYLMPEGSFENRHQAMAIEKMILTHQLKDIGGILTVMPDMLNQDQRWQSFKSRYHNCGETLFELRDDLLSIEQVKRIIEELPNGQFIYSFRKVNEPSSRWADHQLLETLAQCQWIDWAWELGSPEEILLHIPKEKIVLSLHDVASFEDWSKYSEQVAQMKYAPEVSTYSDLWRWHCWQKSAPSKRSFLPRSSNGRWYWYRLLQKGQQKINFWREGSGSAGDQPSLWQWLMMPESGSSFAAVLGDPVHHSYTPLEHSDYFHKKNVPVFTIEIHREEWDEALPILRNLGLSYAAVTSPHKEKAALLCQHSTLKAVNTLYWQAQTQTWHGTSTDDEGFLALIEGVGMIAPLQRDIYVWGGGGTLEMIQRALPHATYFSSRTGQCRDILNTDIKNPKILIWAAPRTSETQFPPTDWKPTMVFDLNYKEDSMGREYAQKCGANYESGLTMFVSQAQGQRHFWNQCEEQV